MNKPEAKLFNRVRFTEELTQTDQWDIIIIGGGATGLGTAIDAASRGFKTLLLEQADFAKGTSSRSTKLVHGGVRYLAQGDIGLVYEALKERGTLLANAPHLVRAQEFIIPCYSWAAVLKYLAGLKLYDWLAGRFSFGTSKFRSAKTVRNIMPTIKSKGLVGGISYYDGQFDDARLAINLAQTAAEHGATVLNYFKVTALLKTADQISGVTARDEEQGTSYTLKGKVVINATGVFVDDILQMDHPTGKHTVVPSQGAHIVLDTSFMPSGSAIMIPKTSDGRVLFAVPWHNHLVVGTTDTPLQQHSLEPVALEQEIDFILNTAGEYLSKKPEKADILSIFAGLRPLAAPAKETGSTKEISRSHKITVSSSGLLSIIGGKWTTYRKMAEDTIDRAIQVGKLPKVSSPTRQIKIHGASGNFASGNPHVELNGYGDDAAGIIELTKGHALPEESIQPGLPFLIAEVVWAVRNEMARTLEDVLARRLRLLFLDARKAIEIAPYVAHLIAKERGLDLSWEQEQVASFKKVAQQYLPQA